MSNKDDRKKITEDHKKSVKIQTYNKGRFVKTNYGWYDYLYERKLCLTNVTEEFEKKLIPDRYYVKYNKPHMD